MKQLLFSLLVILSTQLAYSQIGINTPAPDDNAVLDLKATNKGLLIPRLTTAQREAMSNGGGFAQGMMVYDTDLDILFVGYGNGATGNKKWYAMNAWKTEYKTNNNADTAHMTTMTAPSIKHGRVGIGTASPSEKLEVSGKVKATEFIGNGAVPVGTIVMWSGTTPPDGYVLCTGGGGAHTNHFTIPDLRGKFVVGYDAGNADYNQPGNLSTPGGSSKVAGKQSGAATVALNLSQMPRHNHGVTDPGHKHKSYYLSATRGGGYEQDGGSDQYNNVTDGSYTYADGGTGFTGISTKDAGDTAAHENRPPYCTLAYIMRVY